MTNNDILRRFRYAVDLGDTVIIEMIAMAGGHLPLDDLKSFFLREDDPGYLPLDDEIMNRFLDGLILYSRGKHEQSPGQQAPQPTILNNNVILKKIRIALELREEDMLGLFAAAGFDISRAELSALFRKKGHKNYKECGDQLLRNFLNGLTQHNRQVTSK